MRWQLLGLDIRGTGEQRSEVKPNQTKQTSCQASQTQYEKIKHCNKQAGPVISRGSSDS